MTAPSVAPGPCREAAPGFPDALPFGALTEEPDCRRDAGFPATGTRPQHDLSLPRRLATGWGSVRDGGDDALF
jgi:hypothetical protein